MRQPNGAIVPLLRPVTQGGTAGSAISKRSFFIGNDAKLDEKRPKERRGGRPHEKGKPKDILRRER